MANPNEEPEYNEEEGMFMFGDATIPYCFYMVSSAVFTNDEKGLINENK
jgi:hypothetical protein